MVSRMTLRRGVRAIPTVAALAACMIGGSTEAEAARGGGRAFVAVLASGPDHALPTPDAATPLFMAVVSEDRSSLRVEVRLVGEAGAAEVALRCGNEGGGRTIAAVATLADEGRDADGRRVHAARLTDAGIDPSAAGPICAMPIAGVEDLAAAMAAGEIGVTVRMSGPAGIELTGRPSPVTAGVEPPSTLAAASSPSMGWQGQPTLLRTNPYSGVGSLARLPGEGRTLSPN